jgi:hypothetical protein
MNGISVSVADAARDFTGLLDLLERERASAILTRGGGLVAALSPMPHAARTCAELADRWPHLEKLPPEEATAFADDIEQGKLL